ncbi:MAG: hypothetical protein Q4B26_03460 [Eubacteriales bacterium]|nr:hypothetical protein [Eubacteriales bacterium]
MYTSHPSEPVRLQKLYRKSQLSPKDLEKKFEEAGRETVRLAAALLGYLEQEDPYPAYRSYLKKRIRPAAVALIEENRVSDLAKLQKEFGFSLVQLDLFLQTAVAMKRINVMSWLLKQKAELYGFPDRDFRL